MIDLVGKCLLVTGGSRGIGAAIVRAAGVAGANVILHYGINRGAAEGVRAEVGADRCHLLQEDLTLPGAGERTWRGAQALGFEIDVLVNNAGIFKTAPVDGDAASWERSWDRVLQVNLRAPADLCRAAIKDFRRRGGGKIINIASRAAFRGESPDQMPYGASKGALVTLTKTIARGFAKDGILAFAIAPGFTETEMVSDNLDASAVAAVVDEIPLGEMAPPSEVGALVAFLASDQARHLTGATFDINGASYLR